MFQLPSAQNERNFERLSEKDWAGAKKVGDQNRGDQTKLKLKKEWIDALCAKALKMKNAIERSGSEPRTAEKLGSTGSMFMHA